MKPVNFPERVHQRREEALERRSSDLGLWTATVNDAAIQLEPAELAEAQRKITICHTDINNLRAKLGRPLTKFTKKSNLTGKKNRRTV